MTLDLPLSSRLETPRWLFNRGLTLRSLDARFAARYEAAVAHNARPAVLAASR